MNALSFLYYYAFYIIVYAFYYIPLFGGIFPLNYKCNGGIFPLN
nr:MAG TPA: hypothetical protein [Caudoviricetes sp.]